jgi:hypothetical protein
MDLSTTSLTVSSDPTILQPPPLDLEAPTKKELRKKLQQHAEANGYQITTRSSEDTSIRFVCHRSGRKPSDSSCSQKTDCPFAVNGYEVIPSNTPAHLQQLVTNQLLPPIGTWKIYIKHPGHNHGPIDHQVSLILNRLSCIQCY